MADICGYMPYDLPSSSPGSPITQSPAGLGITSLAQHFHVYYKSYIKGIVQRDLTGVETRLKKSVLLSYSVSNFFFNFKGTPS
jgi:hypothetical protein